MVMLAQQIADSQAREIAEMKMMLGTTVDESHGAPDGGTRDGAAPNAEENMLTGDRRVPLAPRDDVAFIDFLVPHHQMAVTMALMVVERGAQEEVKMLARQIRETQTMELVQLRSARKELTGNEETASPPSDPHAQAEIARMLTLSGRELDRMFLEEMIPHHASGLPVNHRALPNLRREDMRTMARRMFDDQAEEIGEMRMLLRAQRATDQHLEDSPFTSDDRRCDRRHGQLLDNFQGTASLDPYGAAALGSGATTTGVVGGCPFQGMPRMAEYQLNALVYRDYTRWMSVAGPFRRQRPPLLRAGGIGQEFIMRGTGLIPPAIEALRPGAMRGKREHKPLLRPRDTDKVR